MAHAQVLRGIVDGLLAVAAVGGGHRGRSVLFRIRCTAGARLGAVGRLTAFDVVVLDHPVVTLDELGLVATGPVLPALEEGRAWRPNHGT